MPKSQSAIEYLTTYGWAILLIGIAAAVLAELGVFNIGPPSAAPGSCSVVRPLGPGTVTGISLAGTCSGLPPQYVSSVSTAGPAKIYQSCGERNSGGFVAMWFKLNALPQSTTPLLGTDVPYGTCGNITITSLGAVQVSYKTIPQCLCAPSVGTLVIPANVVTGTWYFIAYTAPLPGIGPSAEGCVYTGASTQVCNSITYSRVGTSALVLGSGTGNMILGSDGNGNFINGYLANLQIYNATMSMNGMNSLYLRGVGGAPINLNNLVGWWPLNGNANDYSGQGWNGTAAASNMLFTSAWKGGYTVP
jgi:hypothetical protein